MSNSLSGPLLLAPALQECAGTGNLNAFTEIPCQVRGLLLAGEAVKHVTCLALSTEALAAAPGHFLVIFLH